jgi:hypothetical protein
VLLYKHIFVQMPNFSELNGNKTQLHWPNSKTFSPNMATTGCCRRFPSDYFSSQFWIKKAVDAHVALEIFSRPSGLQEGRRGVLLVFFDSAVEVDRRHPIESSSYSHFHWPWSDEFIQIHISLLFVFNIADQSRHNGSSVNFLQNDNLTFISMMIFPQRKIEKLWVKQPQTRLQIDIRFSDQPPLTMESLSTGSKGFFGPLASVFCTN